MESQVTVVIVPLVAQGHLNQLLHLSYVIAARGLPVHFISGAAHVRQARDRGHGQDPSATANIHFHSLPLSPFDNPQTDPNSLNKFPAQILPLFRALPSLRDPVYSLLQQLSTKSRRVIVIYDSMVPYVVQDVSTLPNAEAYCFQSISAFSFYAFIQQFRGGESMEMVPSMEGRFVPEFSQVTKLLMETPKFHSGDIYNTSRVIEGTWLDLLEQGKMTGTDRHWAIGPFNLQLSMTSSNHIECIEWLDKQELNSVIFVSFGTTVSLSDVQIAEIAVGLEKSGQKFVWVLRDADRGDVFDGKIRRAPLPQGYEERIKGRGIVLRDWAPQLEILRHRSTGGFMSHCGWNSCIESISMGVPMATWPMHSDQPSNAVLVTEVLKLGLEVRDWEQREEVLSSGRIDEAVRRLMASAEGDEIRQRAAAVRHAIEQSVTEKGATHLEMDSFIKHITR